MLTSPRRLLVLDDDPTGSQSVAGIDVALTNDPAVPVASLAEPGSTCFVLTNSRALDELSAVDLNKQILAGVLEAGIEAEGLHVVSRSDSTLRGHVLAEPYALAEVLAEHGQLVDAMIFCPAMIEAGRFTVDDVHYATVDGEARKVENTDFADDATFGYSNSNLREFLSERSGGQLDAADVLSISIEDIRSGGRSRVREILASAHGLQWVVVNATEYADMNVVVDAITELEAEGHTFITRCAPSFVRPLAGLTDSPVLEPESISITDGALRHGLVVVGSHVSLTTQQLQEVQKRGELKEFELDVPSLLDPSTRQGHIVSAVERIALALHDHDCVVYTSRQLVRENDPARSLEIARSVSDAVVEVVQGVRKYRPAWVIAKGGITSHEVATSGLGIRRARVVGQFFPGKISLFEPMEAPSEVIGMPFVVFPGNVGDRDTLAEVVDLLTAAARRDV